MKLSTTSTRTQSCLTKLIKEDMKTTEEKADIILEILDTCEVPPSIKIFLKMDIEKIIDEGNGKFWIGIIFGAGFVLLLSIFRN